ncbi:MAG: hypothetical protein K2M10_06975, partial [Muribaculaceae bacterium]|nr:hypothetical protein [Muribaculaceae bacterium]
MASNNLYSNLKNDSIEMTKAAQNIDLRENSVLLYLVSPYADRQPGLYELRKNGSNAKFVPLKEYTREKYSTDPERISEVIADVKELREAKSYGLILWSHALGWSPFFSNRDSYPDLAASRADDISASAIQEGAISKVDYVNLYSFGSDKNPGTGYTDKIDIDELAEAIPDNMFEFIWFDACMMSGIETIYELRNKCEYFGAYPTEVFSPGMPYDLTLPYLVKEKADMVGCGREFFNYYAENDYASLRTATIAIADMKGLEPVAEYCKRIYSNTVPPSSVGMNYYSGRQNVAYPYYDFGQYTKALIAQHPEEDEAEFERLMDKFIIYKDATEREFTGQPINQEEYSGVSCHLYKPTQT